MAPPIEISIPTTSPVAASGGDKPYTLYNITLRLPLRSYVFQKRYSEFAALHATLTNLVGEAPPTPLPGKSWFRSTVASAELTETRRSGLEAYLRAIAESPDRRWRDTSAWRAFLNLPSTSGSGGGGGSSAASARSSQGIAPMNGSNSTTGTTTTAESRLPAINLAAANAAAASDPGTWIDLHKEMKRALHDARLQLSRRDAALTAAGGSVSAMYTNGGGGEKTSGQSAAVEAGALAKRELVKAGSLLTALTTGLKALQDTKRVGEGELRRRRDLLAAARVERDGLETLSTSIASAARAATNNSYGSHGGSNNDYSSSQATRMPADRVALFGATVSNGSSSSSGGGGSRAFGGGRVLGAPLPETNRTREQDNSGVLQVQRDMMAEQDQEVAALGRIVQRQRDLGLAIKEEVDLQQAKLEQMGEDTNRMQDKMKVAKDRIRKLN